MFSSNIIIGKFVGSLCAICGSWSSRCPYPSLALISPLSKRMKGAEMPYQKKRPRWSECGEKGQLLLFPGKMGSDRIVLVIARLKFEKQSFLHFH